MKKVSEILVSMLKDGTLKKMSENKKLFKWQEREKIKQVINNFNNNKDLEDGRIPDLVIITAINSIEVIRELMVRLIKESYN